MIRHSIQNHHFTNLSTSLVLSVCPVFLIVKLPYPYPGITVSRGGGLGPERFQVFSVSVS